MHGIINMAKTWTLTELVAQLRKYIGRPSTAQISDADLEILINDYYVNHFPSDANVDEFNTFYTQALSATDDGIYPIPQSVARFDDPVTINGNRICFYRDRENFFTDFPDYRHHHHFLNATTSHNTFNRKFEDEQFITNPNLRIGLIDVTKVRFDSFDYRIDSYSYSKSSGEVVLTGSTIPSDKYGAWSLKIDEDGTITVAEATDNAIGYLTPRLALEGLGSSDSETAYMGYVTVIRDGKEYTPGTDLDFSDLTATFTDGRFESRTTPVTALLYGQDLYVWPKPNDIYEFKALQIANRPDELKSGSDAVEDPKWGPAIAIGTANIFLLGEGEKETADDLAGLTKYLFSQINEDRIKRLLGGEVIRSF